MKKIFFIFMISALILCGCSLNRGGSGKKKTSAKSEIKISIPARSKTALGGNAFAEKIKTMTVKDRENLTFEEIKKGNIPDFMRNLIPIEISMITKDNKKHTVVYYVTPDYISIGSDEDFFRMPLTPMTAKIIADYLKMSMITKKISDDIYSNASIKLEPRPMTQDRETVETFLKHNKIIEEQRKSYKLGGLIAGIKKDIIITNKLNDKPGKVALYGWHKLDGKPIQPVYCGHSSGYVDYSHGIRLIYGTVLLDGVETPIETILKSPEYAPLLSDEGTINNLSK